jgi:SAM-dependent methyltransferase
VSESLQRRHYDRIIADYESHYDDPCSARYRERYYHDPLLAGLDLRGQRVLEAMCGTGPATARLRAEGGRVVGLDLSPEAMRRYAARYTGARAVCASFTRPPFAAGSFDAIFVLGALHHLHPHLDDAIDEVHRVLRPGGVFGFIEPHRDALVDRIRRVWYRHDRWFEANEESIDLAALKRKNEGRFAFELERYGGNLAYYLVLNSLILRIPLAWKRFYTPALLGLEAHIGRWQGPASSSFVIARWRKR